MEKDIIEEPYILILNISKIHITKMGEIRIRKNLLLKDEDDVPQFCKNKIIDKKSIIKRQGKNWYIQYDNITITVNAYSYTIITAHMNKK